MNHNLCQRRKEVPFFYQVIMVSLPRRGGPWNETEYGTREASPGHRQRLERTALVCLTDAPRQRTHVTCTLLRDKSWEPETSGIPISARCHRWWHKGAWQISKTRRLYHMFSVVVRHDFDKKYEQVLCVSDQPSNNNRVGGEMYGGGECAPPYVTSASI